MIILTKLNVTQDAPISKFRILARKKEDRGSVVSISLLDYEHNVFILSKECLVGFDLLNYMLLYSDMELHNLVFETIIGISWVTPPEYWTSEDVGIVLLGISTFLLCELIKGGKRSCMLKNHIKVILLINILY